MQTVLETRREPFSFSLPDSLLASEPPEERGASRSDVRLLVVDRRSDDVTHSTFQNLARFLSKGDLLVFNSSRTMPSSIEGRDSNSGSRIELRLAEHLPDDSWLALLLCKVGEPFACGLAEGMKIIFQENLTCTVEENYERITRLWKVRFSKSGTDLISNLYSIGKPISYEYLHSTWGIEYYQNVYSDKPGSMEMPSAGRPFTWEMLSDLKSLGIHIAFVTLHASLSSYLDQELVSRQVMSEEEYSISEENAKLINHAIRAENRVIAVGTTVVRALESSVDGNGKVRPTERSYTTLKINSETRLRVVRGLLTGFHEPEASHLDLLSAFISPDKLRSAYEEAIRLRYKWHEFGDVNLIV